MGRLLRLYWMPLIASEQLGGPAGSPRRMRLLGEDLVAFRDSAGRAGLLAEACPHRRASLFFGRNEEGGLRCVYHGWKFGVDGACLGYADRAGGEPAARQRARRSVPVPGGEGDRLGLSGPAPGGPAAAARVRLGRRPSGAAGEPDLPARVQLAPGARGRRGHGAPGLPARAVLGGRRARGGVRRGGPPSRRRDPRHAAGAPRRGYARGRHDRRPTPVRRVPTTGGSPSFCCRSLPAFRRSGKCAGQRPGCPSTTRTRSSGSRIGT